MKTIKKTTLIAAITAMAAIAVPSMASAATWKPINTNKTLTSTSSVQYITNGSPDNSFTCSNATLGVHVRTPASATLDVTSASFTGCVDTGNTACGTVTVTATGLPWTATDGGTPTNLAVTEHLQTTYHSPCVGPLTIDGPTVGAFDNTTHTLHARPDYLAMGQYYMGIFLGSVGGADATFKDATNTLVIT